MKNDDRKESRLLDNLRRLVEYNNKRDGTVPRNYQPLEELEVARILVSWLGNHKGIILDNLTHNSDDPPDCLACRDDNTIGIEITELVDNKTRHARIKLHEQVKDISVLSNVLLDTSLCHDQERFLDLLGKAIRKKDEKLSNCAQRMPVYLAVFSRDLWLDEETVSQFLHGITFHVKNISGVFFQGDYYNGRYPIQELSIYRTGSA